MKVVFLQQTDNWNRYKKTSMKRKSQNISLFIYPWWKYLNWPHVSILITWAILTLGSDSWFIEWLQVNKTLSTKITYIFILFMIILLKNFIVFGKQGRGLQLTSCSTIFGSIHLSYYFGDFRFGWSSSANQRTSFSATNQSLSWNW